MTDAFVVFSKLKVDISPSLFLPLFLHCGYLSGLGSAQLPNPSTLQRFACILKNPRVSGRQEGRSFSHQLEHKGTLSACHMVQGSACVYIYCMLWGLGHTPSRCFTLGTNISLHPAPIKEHKELFDSLINPTWQIRVLYIVWSPRCCDSVQHTSAVVDGSVLCLLWWFV